MRRAASGDPTPFGALGDFGFAAARRLSYLAERSRLAALDKPMPVAASRRPEVKRYLPTALPMAAALAIPLVAYLVYNAMRFGSPFETGYALVPGLSQARGLVSVFAIPDNLYALLLAPPSIAPRFPFLLPPLVGSMSLVLTTPLLLWAVRAREREWFTVGAWASVGLILVPTLLRADPGGVQFGFRYGQDLLPFLFLLAVRGLRGWVSRLAWVAIGIGVVVNVWGMAFAFRGWWP
jgi:hypothetical protein